MSALPEATVDTIKERLRRGDWTNIAIAEDLGLTPSAVSRIARIHGLSRRQRKVSQPPRQQERMRRIRTDLEWQDRGACNGDWSFTEPGNVAWKKGVCGGCEVREKCLEFSFGEELSEGMVYGGLDAKEIQRLKKRVRAAAVS